MAGSVCLCLIVKDEETTLPRCLASVWDRVDGSVMVDTGSTDDTRAVARRYDVALFEEPRADDFAQARNAAFDRVPVTFDFIFWLDADDVLLEADRQRFRALKAQLARTDANAVSMVYHYAFDDDGGVLLTFRLLRVVRPASHFRWVGRVHEYLEGPGPIVDSDVVVTHRRTRAASDRNLRILRTCGPVARHSRCATACTTPTS
jgi:glycosyltransferase involved in cell wall biosynthesis